MLDLMINFYKAALCTVQAGIGLTRLLFSKHRLDLHLLCNTVLAAVLYYSITMHSDSSASGQLMFWNIWVG